MNHFVNRRSFLHRRRPAIERLARHLDEHGGSLDALLRQVQADEDVQERKALRAMLRRRGNHRDLRYRLRQVSTELLSSFEEPVVDIVNSYRAAEFDAALRWHAGRLDCLERALFAETL